MGAPGHLRFTGFPSPSWRVNSTTPGAPVEDRHLERDERNIGDLVGSGVNRGAKLSHVSIVVDNGFENEAILDL